jgi:hypothetical protein
MFPNKLLLHVCKKCREASHSPSRDAKHAPTTVCSLQSAPLPQHPCTALFFCCTSHQITAERVLKILRIISCWLPSHFSGVVVRLTRAQSLKEWSKGGNGFAKNIATWSIKFSITLSLITTPQNIIPHKKTQAMKEKFRKVPHFDPPSLYPFHTLLSPNCQSLNPPNAHSNLDT